jgi:hypothetical protein
LSCINFQPSDRLPRLAIAEPVEDGNDMSRRPVETYVGAYGGGYDCLVRDATVRPDGRIIDPHRYTVTET